MYTTTKITPVSTWKDYHRLTRTATYGFLIALPLLLLYEVLILVVNQGQLMQVRVGADVWIKRVLITFGGTGMVVLGIGIVLIGMGVFLYERKKNIPIHLSYFGWMVAESIVYAIVIAFIVSRVVGLLFSLAPVSVEDALFAAMIDQGQDIWTMLALSLGAGLYEELLFRVVLVGGLYGVLKHVLSGEIQAYVMAAVLGALLFSAVHYMGALGDAFSLSSFIYRALFGLVLNVLFLVRGFGVAAWTHALYDVMVVTHLLE